MCGENVQERMKTIFPKIGEIVDDLELNPTQDKIVEELGDLEYEVEQAFSPGHLDISQHSISESVIYNKVPELVISVDAESVPTEKPH